MKTKLGYGSAETGLAGTELLLQLYLFEFFVSGMGLGPGWAGLAFSLALIWDAFSDPLMGHISDRTQNKGGRRRPYFLLGGISLAILLPVLFGPWTLESTTAKFFFLLGSYIAVNTAMTIITVPHIAMGGELSKDPGERNSLYGIRFLFGNVGLITATIAPGIYALQVSDNEVVNTRFFASLLIAGFILISSFVAFFTTKGKDEPAAKDAKDEGIFAIFSKKNIKSIARNRPFVILFLAMTIAAMARTFNGVIAMYYYKSRLALEDSVITTNVLGIFIICIMLSVPLWIYIATKYGKRGPAVFGVTALGVLTMITYPFFPAGDLAGPFFMAIAGGLLAGSIVLIDSLLADVVDYDELRTGKVRGGLYFGIWRFSGKIAKGLGAPLAGVMLTLIGLEEGQAIQSESTNFYLALLFGPFVGILFIIAGVIFSRIVWTGEIHDRIRMLISRRHEIRETTRYNPMVDAGTLNEADSPRERVAS